ncbi:MAG TPA: hypothetical protein VK731_10295, partial [Candidatus Cybelea sp.]|nr:hypothetical protein [Candidatus Cybelea sp.]
DQNVFGVPEMQTWFTGRGGTELSKKFAYPGFGLYSVTNRMVVADLMIGLAGTPPPPGDSTVLRWDDPSAAAEAARLLTNALGPTANAPISPFSLGFMVRREGEIRPARIFLQCQIAPTEQDLQKFLADKILLPNAAAPNVLLKFEPEGNGSYHVTVPVLVRAADYLTWSDQLGPQFMFIHQALQRRYARMEGSYERPETIPIPNFITVRSLEQTLAARAECHFLSGQPEEALRDVTSMHDLCRPIMEENKPMTLVSAMIDVAVRGLYANTIADGLRLRAWREPQLAVLEEQLKTINVLAPVQRAFDKEPVGICRTLETTSTTRLVKLFIESQPGSKTDSWTATKSSILGGLLPRGWLFQNALALAHLNFDSGAAVDSASRRVFPEKVEALDKKAHALSPWAPYTCLTPLFIPNFIRAYQNTTHNQTLVHQALIACALERFRLAHGQYPENLDSLIPQFVDKIPHDLIGGQPPHYRRAPDGAFVLYSIGWSGRDGGGVRGKSNAEGDWVWPD